MSYHSPEYACGSQSAFFSWRSLRHTPFGLSTEGASMGIAPYHRLDHWIVLASIKPRYAPTRRAIQSRSPGGIRGSTSPAHGKSKLSILQLRLHIRPSDPFLHDYGGTATGVARRACRKPQKCDGHHSYWQGTDLASIRDQEAPMRKQVSFAVAAAMLGLAVGFWTATGVVESTASFGKSKAPAPTYRVIEVQPAEYLPGRVIEPVY